jgi:hypothetical protein
MRVFQKCFESTLYLVEKNVIGNKRQMHTVLFKQSGVFVIEIPMSLNYRGIPFAVIIHCGGHDIGLVPCGELLFTLSLLSLFEEPTTHISLLMPENKFNVTYSTEYTVCSMTISSDHLP